MIKRLWCIIVGHRWVLSDTYEAYRYSDIIVATYYDCLRCLARKRVGK
ncbi:hypothetical protein KAR91_22280 [Candidatus Pacearchaeota archaeon]|nr:hypothetical protein [Candidatus Pacearchaeota archaeon]